MPILPNFGESARTGYASLHGPSTLYLVGFHAIHFWNPWSILISPWQFLFLRPEIWLKMTSACCVYLWELLKIWFSPHYSRPLPIVVSGPGSNPIILEAAKNTVSWNMKMVAFHLMALFLDHAIVNLKNAREIKTNKTNERNNSSLSLEKLLQ